MKDEKSVRAKEYTRKYTAIYVASTVLCVLVALVLSLTVLKLTEGSRVPVTVPATSEQTQEVPGTSAPTTSTNVPETNTVVPETTTPPEVKVEIKTSQIGNDQYKVGSLVIVNELLTFDPALVQNGVVVVKEQDGVNVWVTTWGIKISESAFKAVNQLQADMKEALSTGYKITITKGFDESDDTKEFATGLNFNFKFMKGEDSYAVTHSAVSKEYKWIKENAWKYGLILRYPEDKKLQTNHDAVANQLRYVGVEHAKYMYENQLCLEEYIDVLKDYTFNEPLVIETEGGKYRVYYIPMANADTTDIQYRSKATNETYGSLVVSGDNKDGFIVSQQFSEK